MIPAQLGAEVESRKSTEDRQRNNLLDDFELHNGEAAVSQPVGGYLEAILEEGDAPADQYDLPQRLAFIFQMAIPGAGHEDVGEDEKNDGPHELILDGFELGRVAEAAPAGARKQ